MSRLTEMCRRSALAAALLVVPLAAQSQAAGGFLGAGAGSRSAAAAMGMGGDVDPAAAAMMGGGTGGMGMDTSMQGLGGQNGLGNLPRGLGRSGLPAGQGMSGGQRPTDFSDPALQGALSRPLAPLEPNEFQKFVQSGTGRLLPIFGASLFDEAPGTFAPVGAVPVPADYVIGPGDEVIVRSTGMLDFELRPVVDRDGQIVLPKVGAVQVAGVRMSDLEKTLTQQVGKSFRNFTLSATLGQLRGIDVYVVGQARRPGKYTLSSLSTLVNALFASGGPNANGSMRRVQLVRANKPVASVDLYDFIVRGDKARDMKLLPGDVIVFPSAGPRVAIAGALNVQAVYELSGAPGAENSVRGLLSYSGGLPVLADPKRAQLERVDVRGSIPREVESFALDDPGLSRKLRDGDLLTLFPISPQFSNAVTLRGNVAAPLRYPHKPGMRVRDLIPDREALITRDYWLRKNLLVQFEDASIALGRGAAGRENLGRELSLRDAASLDPAVREAVNRDAVLRDANSRDAGQRVNIEKARQDVRNILDEVNWDYAVIERLDRDQIKTQLISFNLGLAVLKGDASQNLELLPGDVVTIFGLRDLQVPRSRQTRLVRVEGEVAAPGIYTVDPGETLPQLITRVGGITREAYLFGTELQRESVRQQQTQTLQTVVRRLEEQATASVAQRQANLTVSDPAQLAMQQQRIQMEERLARERLDRLRQLRPSGRIALEMTPDAAVLPDMTLEDGDRIVIPPRPSFVGVAGAVYNENVLLWRGNRSVGDYLKSAGPTESADLDNIFVLRADGGVASRGQGGWFGVGRGTLNSMILAPGDTLVVPEKIDRETNYTAIVRGVKDWTQIIYQLGLGAAAIKVLRN
ncbi:MAG: SLBB domain-containing protein [Burkholderiales bacterium]|nr:SLBB domain-containing protein [Burkholderiales bacterium]